MIITNPAAIIPTLYNNLQPNQYQCQSCNNIFSINDEGWKDGALKPYLIQFICQHCAQHTDRNNAKYQHTTFQCIENCPASRKIFKNKRSLKSWNAHYRKYHALNPQYVTQQQTCNDDNCGELTSNKQRLCLFHRHQCDQPTASQFTANNTNTTTYTPFTMIDEHTMIDADGRPLDVYRNKKYIKSTEE